MKVLVRHVFRVQAYPPLTHSTGMCEILFVTRNATGMFICQDVSLKEKEHQKYHAFVITVFPRKLFFFEFVKCRKFK